MEVGLLWPIGGAGIIAMCFAIYYAHSIKQKSELPEKMNEIVQAIKLGAMTFLNREFKSLIFFVIAIAILLGLVIHPLTAGAFVFGAFCSALAGYLGMRAATSANGPTALEAQNSIGGALRIAFCGGSVLGFSVVGLGLLGLSVALFVLGQFLGGDVTKTIEVVAGFSFGASSVALFARVGGGIYTKAADVGADLVGKVEAGIPEDDPRNPAVVADNVGDNVGDIAGMGADLFESNVASIIGAMTIGVVSFGVAGATLPLMFAALGIFASILGTFFVRWRESKESSFQEQTQKARSALNRGTFITVGLTAIGGYFLVKWQINDVGVYFAALAGVIAGLIIGFITEYYTSDRNKPVKNIAESSQTGPAMTIISGLSVGLVSTALPIIVVAIAIFLAYHFGELFGIAMVAVGLLSSLGMILSVDGYGPITDNAAGIAEMASLGKETRERAEALDSVGNTTAAIGKGFAISSAAFTAFALFWAYAEVIKAKGYSITMSITEPNVLIGLFIGGMLPMLFCAMTLSAVGKAGFEMVSEVRRQFKTIKGLMEGKAKPDYRRCVDISTKRALREMILPGLLAVVSPILVGLILGPEALGGLLAGAVVTGFLLAVMMANAGGAWDNAKKYIEAGNLGGKGSENHKASVVGDTVGDPFKDTSGPSLNILIKLMSIVALVFAPLFL